MQINTTGAVKLTWLIFVDEKKSIWYSIKPKGIRFRGNKDSSDSGRAVAITEANLYTRLVFPWDCSNFIAFADSEAKFPWFVSIPALNASSRKEASAIFSSFTGKVLQNLGQFYGQQGTLAGNDWWILLWICRWLLLQLHCIIIPSLFRMTHC